jgi:hypothetical protein
MFTDPPTPEEEHSYSTFLGVEHLDEELRDAPEGERTAWLDLIKQKAGENNVFLDPDTGIRLKKGMPSGKRAAAFVSVSEIFEILRHNRESLLLCFDQSLDRRNSGQSRTEKINYLRQYNVHACYFVSHTSFLLASFDRLLLDSWVSMASNRGLPANRFEHSQQPPELQPPLPA